MTALVAPDPRWRASWAEALTEFGTDFPHGSGLVPGARLTEADCEEFVRDKLRYADPTQALPEDRVPCTFFWIVAQSQPRTRAGPSAGRPTDELVGFLAVRHRLNDWLLEQGGHIGYSVRPSRRRRGHASRALGLGLVEAGRLGLARVLLTCDEDNAGSRRAIEAAGGVLEDTRQDKRRYWIATG